MQVKIAHGDTGISALANKHCGCSETGKDLSGQSEYEACGIK